MQMVASSSVWALVSKRSGMTTTERGRPSARQLSTSLRQSVTCFIETAMAVLFQGVSLSEGPSLHWAILRLIIAGLQCWRRTPVQAPSGMRSCPLRRPAHRRHFLVWSCFCQSGGFPFTLADAF